MGDAGEPDSALERDRDDALVARAATGEEAAFADLIARHGDRLTALARRMLGPGPEVDDVVQEAFLRLWSQAPAWRPGGAKLSTWLYRVASNLCIDRLRKQPAASLDEIGEPPDRGPRPDQQHAAATAVRQVEAALGRLAPRQRLAIVLCHYEGLTNIEASQCMGLSVDALESLLARGRRTLRQMLAEDGQWLISALRDGGIPHRREVGHG